MRYRITFDGRKAKLPDGKLFLGVNGDNLIDEVAFAVPEYEGAAAYVKLRSQGAKYAEYNEFKVSLAYDDETGDWLLVVSRAILALGYKIETQIQLEAPVNGDDVLVWQSEIFPAYVSDTIKADDAIPEQQAPYLQELDLRVQGFAQRAENASRAQPYVGANGNWYVWDANSMAFVDSGVKAQGPQGPATIEVDSATSVGPAKVENVGTSQNAKLKFTLPAAAGVGVSLADAGGYFPEKNAEAALQKVALQLAEIAPVATQVRRANIIPVLERYAYPAEFAFNNGTEMPLAFQDGDGNFYTPYDVAVHKVTGGKTIYINTATGIYQNNGLTRSTPKGSLEQALVIAGDGDTIIYIDPEGTVVSRAGWKPDGVITHNVNIIAENPIYVIAGDILTYTKTAGKTHVYQVTKGSIDRIVDFGWPEPIEYLKVESIDLCDSTPASYYADGTTLYVHTVDGSAPSNKIIFPLMAVGAPLVKNVLTQNIVCYLENITFVGGAGGLYWLGNATYRDHEIYAKNCRFLFPNSNGSKSGYTVHDCKRSIVQACQAAYSRRDGFAYSSILGATNGRLPDFIEIDCDGYGNGDNILNAAEANTFNGSTAHAGCRGIRINGNYCSNVGGNVVDVYTGTKSVMLGCKAFNSRSESIDYSNGFGMQATGVEMWLNGCKASGNYSDLYALTGSTMHVKNTKFTTKNGGGTWDIAS